MKKIITSILLIALLSSCSLFKKEEEKINISTSSGDIVNIDENGIDISSSTGENVTIDENGNVTIGVSNNDIQINTNTQTDISVEKDIENIIDTSSENTKNSVSEEDILNDIDALINDIIKSAENG